MQLYEQLYWENYDNTEQNRIEVNKQARKEALQQVADANKDPEEELAPELQHGSGYTNLAGRVSYSALVTMHTFCCLLVSCHVLFICKGSANTRSKCLIGWVRSLIKLAEAQATTTMLTRLCKA